MGNFFSRTISQGIEEQLVVEYERRKRLGLTVLSNRFFHNSQRHFLSLSELLRELIAAQIVTIITSYGDLVMSMAEQDPVVRLVDSVNAIDNDVQSDEDSDEDVENDEEEGKSTDPATFEPLEPHLVKSREYLKAELTVRAGLNDASRSILASVIERELCCRGRKRFSKAGFSKRSIPCLHTALGGFCASKKAFLANSFLPNRRKIIDKLRAKTFCCYYAPNETALLTASQDEQIRIYERRGYRQRYYLKEQISSPFVGWSILDLIISPDGKHCVYSTWSDKLYQCQLDISEGSGSVPWTVLTLSQESDDDRFAFFSIRFNRDGSEIIGGASDGRVYLYDRERGQCFTSIAAHDNDVNAVCFGDTNGHLFFTAGDDGICKVWDHRALADGDRPVGAFAGHRDGITFIDSKGDDRYILTNSKDQTIKLWDIRCFSSLTAQEITIKSVSTQSWDYRYEPVPRKLINCKPLEGDGSVYTFRGGHSVLHTLIRAHFSPLYTGQRYIYTGCARGICAIYDILTGKIVGQLKGHNAVVRDCIWHPYENEIITTSWDGVTALWRFDERMNRNINPDFNDWDLGDEDTSDEMYYQIQQRRRIQKRRADDELRLHENLM